MPAGKQRLGWIDVAKGIAMLSILLHHIPFVDVAGGELLSPFVAQYDVCLFFVVAGFFLSTRKPFGQFVRDRSLRLMVPYAVTCLVMGALFCINNRLYSASLPLPTWPSLKSYAVSAVLGAGLRFPSLPEGVYMIGAIWFLQAMLVAIVEVRLVVQYVGERPLVGLAIVGLLAIASLWVAKYVYVPFNVEQGFVAGLVVYLGWLYKTKVGLDKVASPWLVVLLLALFVVAGIAKVRPSFVTPSLGSWGERLFVGLIATALVFCISRIIDAHVTPVAKVLAFYGRNSMVVVCAHCVMLHCGLSVVVNVALQPLLSSVSLNLNSCVCIAIQLVVSALAVPLLRRTPILRRFFF